MIALDKAATITDESVAATSHRPLPQPVPQKGGPCEVAGADPHGKDQIRGRRFSREMAGRIAFIRFETNAELLVWTTTPTSR
jgi:hypothetical protein